MANAACQDGTVTLWLPRGYRAESELEVKRSRFLTTLARVDAEEAAREVIADVRRVHPAARHHCSAFIVEVEGAQHIERSSDDGEPSGTAGAPMLGVLRGSGVTQVVAVVTRYFGGVLLGTGGLVRAYSDAVAQALDAAPRVKPLLRVRYSIEVGHGAAGRFQSVLRATGCTIESVDYSEFASITFVAPETCDVATVISVAAGGRLRPSRVGQFQSEG
ncbi:YigZ family protein [Propioniciclava tarda]|uniref:YigZ family protein n=1 Tax=Propioniciclava tarda TaxID=433330 RepID=A0A4Q9KJ18_PROTD|nr:YigZ family protein [Propioniciclava tarda]